MLTSTNSSMIVDSEVKEESEIISSEDSTPTLISTSQTTELIRQNDSSSCILTIHNNINIGGNNTQSDCDGMTANDRQSESSSWYSVNTSDSSDLNTMNGNEYEYIKMEHTGEYFDDVVNHRSNGLVRINILPPTREEPKYPSEKLKTLVSLFFFWTASALNMASLAIVHDRTDRDKYPPLRDVVFDIIPPTEWALTVSEMLILVSVISCLLMLFLHKHKFIIFRRIFFMMGLLYLMRAITISVTQLPVASTTYYCSPKSNSTTVLLVLQRTIKLLSGFGLSINKKHTFCGDYIFSGHTMTLTLSYLVLKEYTPRKYFILHWLSWSVSMCGVIMVVISRGHYTIDVVIAYYVTSRLFWIYHIICNNQAMKVPSTQNFLSRLWWFRMVNYWEGNVIGVIPRQFEWPLPWPRCLRRRTMNS